jgi:hypothetical protein
MCSMLYVVNIYFHTHTYANTDAHESTQQAQLHACPNDRACVPIHGFVYMHMNSMAAAAMWA